MSMVGQTLGGRYRLDALIGAGGMATVYRARDTRLERDVAVKVLSPNLALDRALSDRFDREARFLAALSHPSIVAVHDVGDADGEPYYVMELVDSASLAERLAQVGRLEPAALVPVIAAVADALGALHDRGFVHRDVKPHNILLAPSGAKLADFGLVRGAEASELTSPGTTVGTLAYLAPELLRGEAATPAADVYALAVVTYLGLTGLLPYPAETVAGLVAAHAGAPVSPSELVPEIGERFDGPLLRALGDVAGRPDARDLAALLEAGTERAAASRPAEGETVVAPAAAAFIPTGAVRAAGNPAGAGGAVTDAAIMTGALSPGPATAASAAARTRPVRRTESTRGSGLHRWILPAVALLATAAIALLLLRPFEDPGGGTSLRTDGSPATNAPTATPVGETDAPTEAPTEPPTAAPTAPPTPAPTEPPAGGDAVAALVTALERYEVAVAEARGGPDGLRGDKAADLGAAARDVRDALRNEDAAATRERVGRLVERTSEIVDDEELEGTEIGAGLLGAAGDVRAQSDAAFGGGGADDAGGDD